MLFIYLAGSKPVGLRLSLHLAHVRAVFGCLRTIRANREGDPESDCIRVAVPFGGGWQVCSGWASHPTATGPSPVSSTFLTVMGM